MNARNTKWMSDRALELEIARGLSRRGILGRQLRHVVMTFSVPVTLSLASMLRRTADTAIAAVLLLLASPLLLPIMGTARLRGRTVTRTPRLGRWCTPFDELALPVSDGPIGRFLAVTGFARLPALWNIVAGDMAFVGPRPVSPGDLSPREQLVRRRLSVRPGLLCLWWIRRRANIDYGSELESDAEYVDRNSGLGDVGIALRAVPALVFGQGAGTAPDELTMLQLRIDNMTMPEAVEAIVERSGASTPSQICFVNADCANIAYRNATYRATVNAANLTLADGIGMKLAGKLLGREIRQNVNGTDLFPRLCEALAGTGRGLYLLGAKPGVTDDVVAWIARTYPDVLVSGWHHGFYAPEDTGEIVASIAQSKASVLLVAFGAPRQDLWIRLYLEATGASVGIGVGGLFDFYSGRTARAPIWLREIGCEWLYRFIQEPGRMWRRYFVGNTVFLARVVRERVAELLPARPSGETR